MTSSFENATLSVVSGRIPGTLITVFDSALRQVDSDYGSVHTTLPPGVYQVEARLGGVSSTRLVTLTPGDRLNLQLTVDCPAAAPVEGISTTHETHGILTHNLSKDVAQGAGPDAGLVLVLRNLRGFPEGVLRPDRVTLYNQRVRPVSEWYSGWVPDTEGSAVGRSGRFPPGPYLLRTERSDDEQTDQTVWLSEGWQTLVFIPSSPLEGPDARGASIHMVRLTEQWSSSSYAARLVETALVALRDGGPPAYGQVMQPWGSLDFDPMLRILGLHLLRQRETETNPLWLEYGEDELRELCRPLRSLVGYHPDVLALCPDPDEPVSLAWPPMLATSYRDCLLPADLRNDHVLQAGSPAERVAPLLKPSPLWLEWPSSATPDVFAAPDFRWSGLDGPKHVRPPSAAFVQLDAVLRDIAGFQGLGIPQIVWALGSTELARRSGLPRTLVKAALREMGMGPIIPA